MKIISIFLLLLLTINAYAETSCQIPEGESIGKPFAKVTPRVPDTIENGDCVLVSFKLVEAPDTNGIGLMPAEINIEFSTNRELTHAVTLAISKWKYRTKEQSAGDILYYSYVTDKKEICRQKKAFYDYTKSGQCVQISNSETGKSACASGEKLTAAIEYAKHAYETSCQSPNSSTKNKPLP